MVVPAASPLEADRSTAARMPPRRALLILNPKARQGKADVSAIMNQFRSAGVEIVEAEASQPGQLSDIVRRYRSDVDAVILGGGDGTLSHAAHGLRDTGLPLGILPLGTANDLARTLGIPQDPVAAAEVIVQGYRQPVDLGVVNDSYFFNVASIGLSTSVTRRLSRELKSRWGVFAYLIAAFQAVVRARPFRAEIVTPKETIAVRTVQVTVGNGRHYGGGMTVDRDAAIDDGVLHLYSLEVRRWWQILPILTRLRRGSLRGSTHVRTLQGQSFEVRLVNLRRRKWVSADGEIRTRTPAAFRLIPQAISIFVPDPGTAGQREATS